MKQKKTYERLIGQHDTHEERGKKSRTRDLTNLALRGRSIRLATRTLPEK